MLMEECPTGTPIYVLYHQSWRSVTFFHFFIFFLGRKKLIDNRKYSIKPVDKDLDIVCSLQVLIL